MPEPKGSAIQDNINDLAPECFSCDVEVQSVEAKGGDVAVQFAFFSHENEAQRGVGWVNIEYDPAQFDEAGIELAIIDAIQDAIEEE